MGHAVARPPDLKTDHPTTKGLMQHLGIGRVIAEIRDDQRIAIVARIDRGQRVRPPMAKQAQLLGLANSE
jgi:hypothetical protein